MPQYVIDNDATATRRRVYFLIYADAAGTPWAGTVTGVKAQRSVSGATEAATTNDVVRIGGAWHYVELTQAETNVAAGDRLILRVAAGSGRLEAPALADVGTDDVFAAAASETTIMATLAGAGGALAREAIADSFLGRAIAGASNGGRTITSALRAIRNRVTRVGTTLTVYAEDDSTTAYTATLSTDAAAAPITAIDPT